jgi:4-hydroxy-3-methylbut-2-enyl diphosphate reductase
VVQRVVLVSPRGFCAGVVRAIATVERLLETASAPVFVRRAIVHNTRVVNRLEAAGAIFVDELDEVPDGAIVVLSAHGAPLSVYHVARQRGLRIVDATCPLVAKVHDEVKRFRRLGLDVLVVGHGGHDEVVGTLGQAPGLRLVEDVADAACVRVADPRRVACVTQTTLSDADLAPLIELRRRFPALVEPPASDVCYATRNRQAAVAWLARNVELVIVVGDRASSNSLRLCEVAGAAGTPACLVEGAADVDERSLTGVGVVGVAAGASTPEDVVREVVGLLCSGDATLHEEVVLPEVVSFRMPRGVAPGTGARPRRAPAPGMAAR